MKFRNLKSCFSLPNKAIFPTFMKIFIGLTIPFIGQSLVNSFHAIGISAFGLFPELYRSKHQNEQIQYQGLLSLFCWLFYKFSSASFTPFKLFFFFCYKICSIPVLIWALIRFDTFIFIFGRCITQSRMELQLLRRLNKKIVFLYVGSDSRPPYLDAYFYTSSNLAEAQPESLHHIYRQSQKCAGKIRLNDTYAHYIIDTAANFYFHTKPYINWFALGLPRQLPKNLHPLTPLQPQSTTHPVRILHCPTHHHGKGTPIINEIITRLSQRHSIDFIKLEGVPNEQVLEAIRHCDFVVDQVYSDTPMAIFATEAAMFGKPAVVGGYFAPYCDQYIPDGMRPPSLFVLPEEMETAIERLIIDVDFRKQLGSRAQAFVSEHLAPEQIARRYVMMLQDQIPPQWWLNPYQIDQFFLGFGLPERRIRDTVTALIRHYGTGSLALDDKPAIAQKLEQWAITPPLEADTRSND